MPDIRFASTIAERLGSRRRMLIIPVVFGLLLLAAAIILRWRARITKRAVPDEARRLWPDISELHGLSEPEVEERRLQGRVNVGVGMTSPSRNDIWRRNLFSVFNLNLIGLAVALLLLGKPLDALTSFAGALFGIAMNVRQQLLAKQQVDEIAAATRAEVLVVRDGEVKSIPPQEIVQGDVLLVGPGDPVFADGQVIGQGQIRMDESAISGRATRPTKRAGDSLYAGSFCVAGRAAYEAQKVGDERSAAALINAERGTYTDLTPLQGLMNQLLRALLVVVVVFVVGFLGVYLFSDTDHVSQFFIDAVSMAFGIAPSGLFFMFIITYAVAAANIAKLGAVVYQPQAVEALAYVDVICLGKTSGLIGMSVEMETIDPPKEAEGLTVAQVRRALGDYAHSTKTASPIIRAISGTFTGERRPTSEEAPFFSAYGWSAAAFDERDLRGVYVLGEADMLQPHLMAGAGADRTRDGEETGEDESPLTAVTGFAKRLTGVLRRGDKGDQDDVASEGRRSGQKEANFEARRSADNRSAPGSTSSGRDEGEADADAGVPENKGRMSRFRGVFQRARTLLRRGDENDETQTLAKAQESEEREVARLLFAYVPDVVPLQEGGGEPKLPDDLVPLCHLRVVQYVREEAKTTIQAFAEQGVEIKFLSSDPADAVAAVAREAGMGETALALAEHGGESVRAISGRDLADLDDEAFRQTVAKSIAFGDLTPEQTGAIVRSLRDQGHQVAMVGDGINHIGALRNANLKITVQSGSEAALSVADIVLLDDSLAVLSQVSLAGQRIVNGLLDMLKLNLVQVGYLALLLTAAIFVGFLYAPQHGSFIALLTLSLPSTGLSMWAASGAVPASVMRDRLIHFALPAALAVTAIALGVHFLFRKTTGDVEYAQLATAYIVTACGLLLVVFVQPPTKGWVAGDVFSGDRRPALLAMALFILFIVISFIRLAQHFLHVAPLRQPADYAVIVAIAALWALVLRFIWRVRPLAVPSGSADAADTASRATS